VSDAANLGRSLFKHSGTLIPEIMQVVGSFKPKVVFNR
jgi:hypothetical protein